MALVGSATCFLFALQRRPLLKAIRQVYGRLRRAKGLSLSIERYGASLDPSLWGSPCTTSLAHVVHRSATGPLKGLRLASLAHRKAPKHILELGTHVGFGTAYLAAGAPQAQIQTIEAAPTLAREAQKLWKLLGIKPHLYIGTFAEVLPRLAGPWDFVYIDGDHRPEALLEYVGLLRPKLSEGGWIVIDDIFWSRSMYKAWRTLQKMPWRHTSVVFPFGILAV